MPPVLHLTPSDDAYPSRLRSLPTPPPHLSLDGPLDPSTAVAIVGTRNPTPEAAAFAHTLAAALVARGGVVVSGGAVGIDAAAHEGALAAGGRTWVVAGTGEGALYPKQHEALFRRVVEGGGAMVWPFPPGTTGHPSRFLIRNGVLVALADVLVIVQARIPSGALNAASWARRQGKPRWVVSPPPWNADDPAFAGCQLERKQGARALTSIEFFTETIGLTKKAVGQPASVGQVAPVRARNPLETEVLRALAGPPRHVDEVVARCGLPYPEVMTALLTLALDDVLVEGPEGFFRQASPP